MKLKTSLLCGLLLLGGARAAQAQTTFTDSWTVGGGAWTASSQSNYATSGIITADAGSESGAIITVSPVSGVGLYTSFFYTNSTTPSFSLSTDTVLVGLSTISFSIDIDPSGNGFTSVPTLDFNETYTSLAAGTISTDSVTGMTTYTWDVSGLGGSEEFSVDWALGQHSAFTSVSLVQATATAVPEPATYAAIFGGLTLVGAVLRRRFAGKTGAC